MAQNVEERSLWIQSFCRVIDAQNGITPEISGVNSAAYRLLIQKDAETRKRQQDPSDKAKRRHESVHIVEGIESYTSAKMVFSALGVKGSLMKKIDHV